MSTLKVSAINNPSAPSGGLSISPAGVVSGPGIGDSQAVFAMSGTLAVTTGAMRWPIQYNAIITGVFATCGTAPTGAVITVDVNVSGTTIFTTQANRPTIQIGSNYSGVVTNMNTTTMTAGQYITVDVDTVGSTITGSNLMIFVTYIKA